MPARRNQPQAFPLEDIHFTYDFRRTSPLQFRPSCGTAAPYLRSIRMSEVTKRSTLRRMVNDRLYAFHRTLVTQFSSDAETFLERAQVAPLKCPACGAQMILSMSIASSTPQEPDQIFTCKACGVSYMTRDYIPVYGRAAKLTDN